MPFARILAVFCFLLISACSQKSPIFQEDMPKGQLGQNVIPQHYQLTFDIDPTADGFDGNAVISIKIDKPVERIWIHGSNLNVSEVYFSQNGSRTEGAYSQHDDFGVSSVDFNQPVKGAGDLVFTYSGGYSASSEALFKVEQEGKSYIYSQLQAISARRVFPGFDDPQFKTTFSVSVSSDANNKVVVNTPELNKTILDDGRVLHDFATSKPLPTYLLAFAVGPFDIVEWDPIPKSNARDHEIPLRGVAVAGMGEKMRYSLEHTARFVEILEDYFNIPYPYEKIDLIAAAGHLGAMENPGAIIYSESLLFVDEDSSLNALRWFARVHAHELAHMWFGDLVTPKWWEDIWLNEAFASWMELKVAHEWNPNLKFDRAVQKGAFDVMGQDSTAAAREIMQPVLENKDIGKTFDGITYSKGAAVLEMVESFVGEEKFRIGVHHHLTRYLHGTASSSDFFQSMSEGAESPELVEMLTSMVDRTGVPLVEVSVDCSEGKATLNVAQSRYKPLGAAYSADKTWSLPFCYKTDMGTSCELLNEKSKHFELTACPNYLLPNSDGDGYYRWKLDEASLAKLLEYKSLLSPSELLSLNDSLTASYYAGEANSFQLLRMYQLLADHPDSDVAMAPSSKLPLIRRQLLDNAVTDQYSEFVHGLYGEKLQELGFAVSPDENVDIREVRTELLQTMAFEARDADVRDTLSSLAQQKYLAGADTDTSATNVTLPADWEQMSLVVAMEEGGYGEALKLEKIALSSDIEEFRDKALYAVAQSSSDEFLLHLQSEILPDEEILSANRLRILFGLRNNYNFQEANWNWAKENIDLTLSLLPELFKDRVTYLGTRFCSKESKEDLLRYFAGQEEAMPGIKTKADEVSQYIEQCVAFSRAKSAELKAALAQAVDNSARL